jgi:peptide chain release factor 3
MTVMDEIERELGMAVVPFTWPVGMVQTVPRRVRPTRRRMGLQPRRGKTGGDDEVWPDSTGTVTESIIASPGRVINCVAGATPNLTASCFWPASKRRCSSARPSTTLGVQGIDALVDRRPRLATAPPCSTCTRKKNSRAWCKIQTNMDQPCDRIAFCAWPAAVTWHAAPEGGAQRTGTAAQHGGQLHEPAPGVARFLSQATSSASPNHGVLQLGDTLTEGRSALQFTGLPFCAGNVPRRRGGPTRCASNCAGLTAR